MENVFKLNRKVNFAKIEAKYEKIILIPYYHIIETKGKGFRNVLIEVYNHWLKIEKVDIELITDFIQWMHSNSMLVDDIQDSSKLRRGNPAAHVVYGISRTITAVNISMHSILLRMMNSSRPERPMFVLDSFRNLLEGQIMEIHWRDNFICPSEEDYFDMAIKKTGHMFLFISNLMELCSKIKVDLKRLSILLGLYFQLSDDYRGLKSKLYCESKGFCDDIREGKFIFPIIHAINSRPNDKRILDILKMRTNDSNFKIKCLELLEEFGSMEYTRNKNNIF